MKINKKEIVQVDAKVLKLHLKVCDQFTATLLSDTGNILNDYEGYVPSFLPGEHFGDYVIFDIDIDTGQILNWKIPSVEDVQKFIDGY